jgi:hypothetical protein
MDTNFLLGVVMLVTGVADLAMARSLGDKLPPAARIGLSSFGVLFLVLGAALVLRFVRVV